MEQCQLGKDGPIVSVIFFPLALFERYAYILITIFFGKVIYV